MLPAIRTVHGGLPMTNLMIRTATADDVSHLAALSEIWHRDCEIYGEFDHVRATKSLERVLALTERVAIVAEDRGALVGMLVGLAVERWFSAERAAQILAFVVRPEYRGGNVADRILAEFQAQAIQRGAYIAEVSMLAGHGFAAARQALGRADFYPVGNYWAWSAADHLVDGAKGGRH